jgi:hypothetical protein
VSHWNGEGRWPRWTDTVHGGRMAGARSWLKFQTQWWENWGRARFVALCTLIPFPPWSVQAWRYKLEFPACLQNDVGSYVQYSDSWPICIWRHVYSFDWLTPKIPGPFLPISTSKMLKFSKKFLKNLKNLKMLKSQPHKDYDLSDSLKKSCQKILKILTMVACRSSCNPLWVLWNFRG